MDMFNKRIELLLYHPLKPKWVFWVLFVAIVFEILIILHLFNNVAFSLMEMAIPIIVSIIIFYFTQKEIKMLEYADALKKLLDELKLNKESYDDFCKNVDDRFTKLGEEKKWTWMPKKTSYTNWATGHNFQHKFFSTNAYFNFVNRGYILDDKYLPIPRGEIANVYESCFDFNVELQRIENLLASMSNTEEHGLVDAYDTECSGNAYPICIAYQIDFDFKGVVYNFDSVQKIQDFLKTEFYTYYAKDHINGGFSTNYQVVQDSLGYYYNFDEDKKK